MEVELPPWLDATFLAASLQGGEVGEPPVTVTKFSGSPAVAAGNNYLSRLYRVRLEYTTGGRNLATSLIVKAPLTKGITTEVEEFYSKEPNVYRKLLPLLKEKINWEFGPSSFFSSVENVLVLADLNDEGYVMCNRHKQLDFRHCVPVLENLAKFHAASVACKKDHPDLIELVGKEVYCVENKFESEIKPWIQNCLRTVATIVTDMKLGNEIVDYLVSKADTAAESMMRVLKPSAKALNVLNHGDMWTANILFKYRNSEEIDDLRFIDFQVLRYAIPVLDIVYFFWTSANENVREEKWLELCEIYRFTLNTTLEQLGCTDRLTEEEFSADIKEALDMAVITICNALPIIVSEEGSVINMEDVNAEDIKGGQQYDSFKRLFTGKHYLELLPIMLEQLLRWVAQYE